MIELQQTADKIKLSIRGQPNWITMDEAKVIVQYLTRALTEPLPTKRPVRLWQLYDNKGGQNV